MIRTVANPAKDGRKTDWTGAKTFDEGTRFIDNGSTIKLANGDHPYNFIRTLSAEGKAVTDNAAEDTPHTANEFVEVNDGVDAEITLRAMFKLGRVSADDFKVAGEYINSAEGENL
jgi:hypothetical protein